MSIIHCSGPNLDSRETGTVVSSLPRKGSIKEVGLKTQVPQGRFNLVRTETLREG